MRIPLQFMFIVMFVLSVLFTALLLAIGGPDESDRDTGQPETELRRLTWRRASFFPG